MVIRKYMLRRILESYKKRGLTEIQQTLDESNEFENTDIVVRLTKIKKGAESSEENKK